MNSGVVEPGARKEPIGQARMAVTRAGKKAISVVTGMNFSASAEEVWEGLMFYEQIGLRPPLLLRLLLPSPLRTEGRKSAVGDEVTCRYLTGHLLKRATQITPGRSYAFEVIEQSLTIGVGIRLLGGSYQLRELAAGCTQVALETRYMSPNRPRWLCERIEAAVCHLFHRYILSAMRRHLQAG